MRSFDKRWSLSITHQEFIEGTDKTQKGKIIDPENIERELNFESLYFEFIEKKNKVTVYLAKLYQDLGEILEKE